MNMNENMIPSIPRSETSDVLDIIIPRLLDAKFMTRLEAARDAMRVCQGYDHLAVLQAIFRVPDDGPDI